MKNVIEDLAKAVVEAAASQTNQVANELNALATAIQHAQHELQVVQKVAATKRAEADKIEDAGMRDHVAALLNILVTAVSIVQQLNDGMMVTGSTETPALTKPKLVVSGAQAVAS